MPPMSSHVKEGDTAYFTFHGKTASDRVGPLFFHSSFRTPCHTLEESGLTLHPEYLFPDEASVQRAALAYTEKFQQADPLTRCILARMEITKADGTPPEQMPAVATAIRREYAEFKQDLAARVLQSEPGISNSQALQLFATAVKLAPVLSAAARKWDNYPAFAAAVLQEQAALDTPARRPTPAARHGVPGPAVRQNASRVSP